MKAYAIRATYDAGGQFAGLVVERVCSSYKGRKLRAFSALRRRREDFLYNTEAEAAVAVRAVNVEDCPTCRTGGSVYAAP